jgi:hypothetical protein
LLASERAFSIFFTLASVDLVAFSAVALAAVATSLDFLEASSSASREEMRALAVVRASAVQQKRKEKLSEEAKKGIQDKQHIGKKITLGGPISLQVLDTFIAQGDKLLHQVLSRKVREYESHAKNRSKYASSNTHIVGGACRPMSLKRSAGVCRLLHARRTASNDDLLNMSPWGFGRFHRQIGLL